MSISAFDALRIATENLPETIHTQASWRSIWLSYIQRSAFPKNAGVNQTTFIIGNSEPVTNSEAWSDVTLSSNAISGACSSSYTDVDVGYTERTYVPRRFGLAGPVICRETLMFAHNPTKFISQYKDKLVNRAKRSWEFQLRNAYTAIADKGICRTGSLEITQNSTTLPQLAAQSALTWDYLDEAAITLMQAGATNADESTIELGADGPLFPLVIGLQAKQRLFTNVSNKRTDVQFAQEGMDDKNLLFRRIGATDTHKNFRMVPELFPPRYSFTDGIGYVEIPTWEMVDSSEGKVARVTSAWKNAIYEGAHILHPQLMNAQMISPDSAGLDWSPSNYMGEWVWETGNQISDSYSFDPLKKYGRHFAEFMYAPEAVFPNYGMVIIFKRCPNDIVGANCVAS